MNLLIIKTVGTEKPNRQSVVQEIFRLVIAAISHPTIRPALEKLAM